jgi:hypothetical protein
MFDMTDTLPAGYGEHAMERQDTNNPLAFPGNVTDADRVNLRSPADAAGGLVPHTSMYGAPISFADPNAPAYAYTVDLATGLVRIDRAPAGKFTGTLLRSSNATAYDAIIALAKQQPGAAQAARGDGWQRVAEAGGRFIDAYTQSRFPSPSSLPSGVAVDPNALAVQPSSTQPSTGIPWWVWAAGAVVVGVVVWGATKGGGEGDDE